MTHDGHRERLKKRFLSAPDSFEDHELLELLLFYAIPRRNTNDIAHFLLDRHGSVRGVFDANISSLCQTDGIGENSAIFLRAVSEILMRYERSICTHGELIDSCSDMGRYVKSLFVGTEQEITYLLLFNNSKKLIGFKKVGEGYSCENLISVRDIVEMSLASNASCAVLAHNHPNGQAVPSSDDLYSTRKVEETLRAVGVTLVDHFIIAGERCTPIIHPEKAELYNA